MKKFTYTNIKTGKIIFETIEPNYASRETVDPQVREKTGHDPRIERHLIECQIRMISEQEANQLANMSRQKRPNQRSYRPNKRSR